jgi:hypothetical protein
VGAWAPCGLNIAFASIHFTAFKLQSTPSSAANRLAPGSSAAPAKWPKWLPSVSRVLVSSAAARERLPKA